MHLWVLTTFGLSGGAGKIVETAVASRAAALDRRPTNNPANDWINLRNAHLKLPADTTPWGVVHLVGGAGLAVAPQLCYDELAQRIVERAGVAVIATPYEAATNHSRLAQAVRAEFDDALELCVADGLLPSMSSAQVARLGHSLGAKLVAILSSDEEADPSIRAGYLAFNNFDVEGSVVVAAEALLQLQSPELRRDANVRAAIQAALALARSLGSAQGVELEFTPPPRELCERVSSSHAAAATVLRFEGDALDSSDELIEALGSRCEEAGVLRGGHFAPVTIRLRTSDVAEGLDPAVAMLLRAQLGDAELCLGEPELVDEVADAIVRWLRPVGGPAAQRSLPLGDSEKHETLQ